MTEGPDAVILHSAHRAAWWCGGKGDEMSLASFFMSLSSWHTATIPNQATRTYHCLAR